MGRSAEWCALFTLLLSTPAGAGESDAATLELLEFLGTWETGEGEWIDPTELAEMPELDAVKERDDADRD